jgi:hypothetical protein
VDNQRRQLREFLRRSGLADRRRVH